MHKLTITQSGRAYFDLAPLMHQDQTNTTIFPIISKQLQSSKENIELDGKTLSKASLTKVNMQSLRTLLKNDSIDSINRLKEQTEHKAYRYIREELMRDISQGKQFLSSKAESLARKIMAENQKQRGSKNLSIEIGKGRNYLSKIIKEFQVRQEDELKLKNQIKQRLRAID